MAAAMDYPTMVQVAQMFVKHYYTTFDTNRSALGSLYQNQSMLSFEGENKQGAQAIVEKLTTLKFVTVAHIVKTVDVQPSGAPGGILVFVNGDLKIDGGENPLKFAQTFHLMPLDSTMRNFFVLNDFFRLNIG